MNQIGLEERIEKRFDDIAHETMCGIDEFKCCIGCKLISNHPAMDECKAYPTGKPEEAYEIGRAHV